MLKTWFYPSGSLTMLFCFTESLNEFSKRTYFSTHSKKWPFPSFSRWFPAFSWEYVLANIPFQRAATPKCKRSFIILSLFLFFKEKVEFLPRQLPFSAFFSTVVVLWSHLIHNESITSEQQSQDDEELMPKMFFISFFLLTGCITSVLLLILWWFKKKNCLKKAGIISGMRLSLNAQIWLSPPHLGWPSLMSSRKLKCHPIIFSRFGLADFYQLTYICAAPHSSRRYQRHQKDR